MQPKYTVEKIRFSTDPQTFEKAIDLYEAGRVTQMEKGEYACSAVVLGTKPYRVSVEYRNYTLADCECYLGRNDIVCKHVVAVALACVLQGEKLPQEERHSVGSPVCSGKLGQLSAEKLKSVKQSITASLRYIKSYSGPSRTWFAYQDSLLEGCSRLSHLVSQLPVSMQTARLLVDLLLRLDTKLCTGGVDDSDGAVGGFMEEAVLVLMEYMRLDPACMAVSTRLEGRETCFGWEEPLWEYIDAHETVK